MLAVNGPAQKLTLTGSPVVVTLTSPASGLFRQLTVYLVQDATGARLVTWPGSVRWGTVGVPTLSVVAAKTDVVRLTTVDGGVTWLAVSGGLGF